MWQETHGHLSSHWKSVFLRRTELDEIILYPRHAIEDALASTPKLNLVRQILNRRWVKSAPKNTSPPTSNERPASSAAGILVRPGTQPAKSTLRAKSRAPKKKPKENNPDLAAEGKILPLPDDPKSSRKRGSPGYRTGIEAELRSIAQKHKWF